MTMEKAKIFLVLGRKFVQGTLAGKMSQRRVDDLQAKRLNRELQAVNGDKRASVGRAH